MLVSVGVASVISVMQERSEGGLWVGLCWWRRAPGAIDDNEPLLIVLPVARSRCSVSV